MSGIGLTTIHMIMILLILLSISISVNFYFLFKKQDNSIDSDVAEKVSVSDEIEAFIDAQIIETKKFLKGKPSESFPLLNNKVVALRTAYLNIEKKALRSGVDTKTYWAIINHRLLKLLSVFLPQLFSRDRQISELENRVELLKQRVRLMGESQSSEAQQKTIRTLDGFVARYRKNIKDQEIVDRYLSKMERMVKNYEDPVLRDFYRKVSSAKNFAKSSAKTFDDLHKTLDDQLSNITSLENQIFKMNDFSEQVFVDEDTLIKHDKILSELESLKKENQQLMLYIETLKTRIIDYDDSINKKRESFSSSSYEQVRDKQKAKNISDEIEELSIEISEITEKEINRLRDLLGRQRKSIAAMDETIDQLREALEATEHVSSGKDGEIERLQKCVGESEMCIVTLEQLIAELYEVLDLSKSRRYTVDEGDFESLDKELNEIKQKLINLTEQNKINEGVVSFYREALEAGSIEDLAALVYQQLCDYSCNPSFELLYNNKTVSVSSSGIVSPKDRNIINNLQLNEIDIDSGGRSIKFKMPRSKGVLCFDKNADTFKDNQKHIIGIIRACDNLVDKIGSMQLVKMHKKTIDICQNSIKKVAYEIDQSYDAQFKRAKNFVNLNVSQVQDIARSAGVDSAKIEALGKIEVEAIKELEADESLRLKVRKQFLALIKQLGGID